MVPVEGLDLSCYCQHKRGTRYGARQDNEKAKLQDRARQSLDKTRLSQDKTRLSQDKARLSQTRGDHKTRQDKIRQDWTR